MKYYLERNNILKEDYKVNPKELREYFLYTYNYFLQKENFKPAFCGIYSNGKQLKAPTMVPSPELYFLKHLKNPKIYPIEEYYRSYNQYELFTVIEVLHNHIARYNHEYNEYEAEEAQEEFREHINAILRLYDKGYFIDRNGYIMELPNDALLSLVSSINEESGLETIIEKLKTAIKMYLHFTSNHEEKRKAINILADILEPLRAELKEMLNKEWEFNKKDHNNMIFEIVNKFNIRHNKEVMNYSEEIWFEWMFHYYISVIKTYYRLKKARESI